MCWNYCSSQKKVAHIIALHSLLFICLLIFNLLQSCVGEPLCVHFRKKNQDCTKRTIRILTCYPYWARIPSLFYANWLLTISDINLFIIAAFMHQFIMELFVIYSCHIIMLVLLEAIVKHHHLSLYIYFLMKSKHSVRGNWLQVWQHTSPVTSRFPSQRASNDELWFLCLNNLLKQRSSYPWLETPWRPCDFIVLW